MLKNHVEICLYKPEIPQNTGNIARLTAGSGSRLHLIRPFGFNTDDHNLKRAGLDYWPYVDLEVHSSLEELLDQKKSFAFFSKKAKTEYTKMPQSVDLLIFGQETSGFPDSIFEKYSNYFYRIPMFHPGVRCFNLANSVSIVLYWQMYQRGLLN